LASKSVHGIFKKRTRDGGCPSRSLKKPRKCDEQNELAWIIKIGMGDAQRNALGLAASRQQMMAGSSESTLLEGVGREAPEQGRETSPLEEEVLALFDLLHDRLLAYLLRFNPLTIQDCEEVLQETFLALFQHLQRGRSQENLNGWLFRVAHNFGLKRLRVSRRDALHVVALSRAVEETVADGGHNAEDTLAQNETRRRLIAVVNALPEQEQRCLALRAEGLRYREIAEVLGISLGAVAKSLERSLARITRATQR
jgi:RNA polymerase sigma-70 factor (ECF subfamily)